jgi:hypothetical protein
MLTYFPKPENKAKPGVSSLFNPVLIIKTIFNKGFVQGQIDNCLFIKYHFLISVFFHAFI